MAEARHESATADTHITDYSQAAVVDSQHVTPFIDVS